MGQYSCTDGGIEKYLGVEEVEEEVDEDPALTVCLEKSLEDEEVRAAQSSN